MPSGPFFGGALGIFAYAWMNWVTLAFAVLFGGIIAFYHFEIWQSMRAACQTVIIRGAAILRRMLFVINSVPQTALTCLRGFRSCIQWVLEIPRLIYLLRHPEARLMIRILSIYLAAVYLNILLWIRPFFGWCGHQWTKYADPDQWVSTGQYLIIMLAMMTIVFLVVYPVGLWRPSLKKDRNFIWSSLCDLLKFFGAQVITAGFLTCVLIWMAGLVGIGCLLVVIVVPSALAIGFIQGIASVIARTDHWVCVGVTLAVTSLVAGLTQIYLNNVWVAAALAGSSSAVLTTAVRWLGQSIKARFGGLIDQAVSQNLKPLFDRANGWVNRWTRLWEAPLCEPAAG